MAPEEMVGNVVAEQLQKLGKELEGYKKRLRDLLRHASGGMSRCRDCGAEIYFVHHPANDRVAPYDPDGTNHFATCPHAANFRRKS